MKKLVLILLIAVLLSACNNDMSDMRKAKSEYFCKDRGGFHAYHYGEVYCNNGEKKGVSEVFEIVIEDENYYPESKEK